MELRGVDPFKVAQAAKVTVKDWGTKECRRAVMSEFREEIKLKLLCRLFGHKIYAEINETGQEFNGFTVWGGELICSRCDRRVEFIHRIEINKQKKNENTSPTQSSSFRRELVGHLYTHIPNR